MWMAFGVGEGGCGYLLLRSAQDMVYDRVVFEGQPGLLRSSVVVRYVLWVKDMN